MGAERSDIRRRVTGRASTLLAVGIASGALGSLSLMGLLRGVSHDVSPGDPVVLASCVLAVLLAGIGAAAVPAHLAASAEPLLLLRSTDE